MPSNASPRVILGINAFHGDSAACLLRDGELLAAAEEERFRRIKHWAGFPSEAIRYCLQSAGIGLEQVDAVAVNQDGRANLGRKLLHLLVRRPDPSLLLDRWRNKRKSAGSAALLAQLYPDQALRAQVHAIEHHQAHLSAAFHVSPFADAVAVSVDGFGDFASTAWGVGHGTRLELDGRIYYPHSLGIFYQALTQFLGFGEYGDEYKVMGLAPYGDDSMLPALRTLLHLEAGGRFRLNLQYFRHHRENVHYEWQGGSPRVGALYSGALAALLGPARAADEPLEARHRAIAYATQALYEEAFFHLLNHLHRRYALPELVLSGGCAMNSVANGKVRLRTPFRRLYVQAAAGDAGGAVGAALTLWHRDGGAAAAHRGTAHAHAYWGPAYASGDIRVLLAGRAAELAAAGCIVSESADEASLCAAVARGLADGEVVGWFQGRMEWGARALGNRSILCDPRRADMKQILNERIKRRESFRPFAPAILREAVADWFEQDDDVPFMSQVFQMRAERRTQVPAVTHIDGSGRLQTVHAATNPRFHALISAFRDLTGVPLLLNTSFNENEPIVCRPEEALDCFLRTRMDTLVLGEFVVRRAHG